MIKLHIKKGDVVKVISGEERGNQGRVIFVDVKKRRAVVEGLNMVSKHTKPNTSSPQGGIVKKEASIHISNLMLFDSKTGKVTRVGRKRNKEGNLIRYSKKTGEDIK